MENPGSGFSCGICGKGFGMEKGHCKRHIKNVHSKSDSCLSCEFCQKPYKNYDSLSQHQRTVHGVYKQWIESTKNKCFHTLCSIDNLL